MNARYLYRAKRKNWRELPLEKWWAQGYLVNKKCGKYNTVGFEEFEEMVIVTQFSDGGIDWCYIDKDTICQCTGKTDIEKNLIFEHDAVSFLDATSTEYGYSEHWQVGEVLWDDETASFQVTERLSAESYEVLEDCKVLGNTIDNSELLEVGE